MSSRPTRPGRRWRVALLLGLVLVAGMGVRFWYLDWGLHSNRFWDERFSFENVLELRRTGSLEPASGFYPLLSYLPQALLLSASDSLHRYTGDASFEVHNGMRFTPNAYRLSRLVEALWGVAGLWLTFLIGRRLFSPATGLIAATAMAFSPWHIHSSAVFKPDAPLTAAVLLAFYWSLWAVRSPSVRNHVLAGAGIALALSMKPTGGLAALPLAFVSLLRSRREPRRLWLLALSAGVALGLFLLFNPYWPAYFQYLERNIHIYERKAVELEMTRWQAPLLTWDFIYRDLGPAITLVGAAAAIVLLVRLARRVDPPQRTWDLALLLLLPPVWVAGYMLATEQFKPNNFLPLLPFVAILAAWGLTGAWRWWATRRELSPGRRRLLGTAGVLLVLFALVPPGVTYVYRSLTPMSEDLALRFAASRMEGKPNCEIVYEWQPQPWPPWEYARPFRSCHLWRVDRLTDLDLDRLDVSDGVLFPRARLDGEDADFYLAAVAASGPRYTTTPNPVAWRVRGPAFVAALHGWQLREPERTLALRVRGGGEFQVEAAMPAELIPGEVISFSLWLPRQAIGADMPAPRLKTGNRLVELKPAAEQGAGLLYVSERMANRRPGPRVRVNRRAVAYAGEEIQLTVWRWQRDPAMLKSRLPSKEQTQRSGGLSEPRPARP